MLDMFRKLFFLLSRREKRDFFILQFFMLLTALAELFGTVSILPFIAIAAKPELIIENRYVAEVNNFFGYPLYTDFLLYLGIIFGLLVLLSNALLLLSQFLMNRFSFRLGREMSSKLFRYYLSREVMFHTSTNSSTLIQRTMNDANTLSSGLFAAALKLNGRIFSILLLTSILFVVSFWVAIITLATLSSAYALAFFIVRKRISKNSLQKKKNDRERTRWLNEAFEGIKDIKLYSAESMYEERYISATRQSNKIASNNLMLSETPYYVIESIVLCGVVLITLHFIASEDSLTDAIASLTLFCMAGFKLVPKMQQSYKCVAQMRAAEPIFNRLHNDIQAACKLAEAPKSNFKPLTIRESIELKGVSFGYRDQQLFSSLDLNIPAGKITAIVGPSGSGKSTLLDILMGLIQPDEGHMLIDARPVLGDDLNRWQASVGYVPQLVYLTDASIAENIAFGIELKNIDMKKVEHAARLANLHDFIETLPNQYLEHVGERGSRISGGQRQRIGIARAFYRDISVLVLDEATSALDTLTQASILDGLKSIEPPITVVMVTHREETIAFADYVYNVNSRTSSITPE